MVQEGYLRYMIILSRHFFSIAFLSNLETLSPLSPKAGDGAPRWEFQEGLRIGLRSQALRSVGLEEMGGPSLKVLSRTEKICRNHVVF